MKYSVVVIIFNETSENASRRFSVFGRHYPPQFDARR
jgi:hypothetical protein